MEGERQHTRCRRQTASCREGSVVHGPSPVLWDDGEGWGWEAPEEGGVRTRLRWSLCHTAEISTKLWANIFPRETAPAPATSQLSPKALAL